MELSDLTIIIPTFNRSQSLKRLLKYLFMSNIKTNILILDASPIQINNEILESYSSRLLITYKNYNTSKEYTISVPKRINAGLKHVCTRYCLLHADDDFVLPSGLKQSINFLEANQDYVSCEGISYQHYLKPYLLGKALSLHLLRKNPLSSDSNNPLNRIKNYIQGKTDNVHYYAVYKTETFKKIWLKTSQISYNISVGLEEIFPCSLSLVYGKHKILKIPYSSREPITNDFLTHFLISNYRSIYSKEKLDLTANLISEELYKLHKLDQEYSKDSILKSLNCYLELGESSISRSSKPFFMFRRNLRMMLSNIIKYVPRKLGLIRPNVKGKLLKPELESLISALQSSSQTAIKNEITKSQNLNLKSQNLDLKL